MSDEQTGYGYVDDEKEIDGSSGLSFGLNQGIVMSKFEYIKNGGKDGAEQEALDIVFTLPGGVDKNMRKFPITKAFKKGEKGAPQEETTDPKSPEMQEAFKDFNAIITHIMHCFVSDEDYKVALSVPVASFEQFCKILMGLLPKDFNTIKLDVFAQWGWQIKGDNNKTYLELPSKMKYGRWLCVSKQPLMPDPTDPTKTITGEWVENRKTNPQDNDNMALSYTDQMGNLHPFVRNGWFMNSNFANQQKDEAPSGGGYNPAMAPPVGAPPAGPTKGW